MKKKMKLAVLLFAVIVIHSCSDKRNLDIGTNYTKKICHECKGNRFYVEKIPKDVRLNCVICDGTGVFMYPIIDSLTTNNK